MAHALEKLLTRPARGLRHDERLLHGAHRFAAHDLGALLARLQIDPELDSRPELADRDRAGERRDSESEMPVGEVRIDHVRVV